MKNINSGSNLAALAVGQRGVVTKLTAKGISRRRMLDLGLVPGTVVESARQSPAGDPTAYLIRGSLIALRSEEGCQVLINLL